MLIENPKQPPEYQFAKTAVPSNIVIRYSKARTWPNTIQQTTSDLQNKQAL